MSSKGAVKNVGSGKNPPVVRPAGSTTTKKGKTSSGKK